MIDIRGRLRNLREFVNYSQDKLADELGMTQAAYSKLETGKTKLDLERLDQLATFYGLTITDLLNKDFRELQLQVLTNSIVSNKQ